MNTKRAETFCEQSYLTLLETESIATLFQPIVSVKKQSIIGFEALSRGIGPGNEIIPPDVLFGLARTTGTSLELDRLCRQKALENYARLHEKGNEYLLSINLDSTVLSMGRRSDHLFNAVQNLAIDPSYVIIELLESEVEDMEALYDFVQRYREHKFLIAVDDIGSGFSNLERVIFMQPDVIKIDRSLVTGIEGNFYRQEVVRSIISMAHSVGSVIIAEGIETEHEAVTCIELGSDLLQGYYFSRPGTLEQVLDGIHGRISFIAGRFKEKMVSRVRNRHIKFTAYDSMIDSMVSTLSTIGFLDFEEFLMSMIRQNPIIECIYILDECGIQVSKTICSEGMSGTKKIFKPDSLGTDQSFKDYFLYLNSGLKKYTSEQYISGASGRLCITISTTFTDKHQSRYVLCCDIREN